MIRVDVNRFGGQVLCSPTTIPTTAGTSSIGGGSLRVEGEDYMHALHTCTVIDQADNLTEGSWYVDVVTRTYGANIEEYVNRSPEFHIPLC
jgi:hypothetical protein